VPAEISQLDAGDGKTLGEVIALEVGILGENIVVRRASSFRAADAAFLGSYVHQEG
jgi:translation elongation factor EF-Ts